MAVVWDRLDEWKTHLYDKNAPAQEFGKFETFKQLWDDKRINGALPAWENFKFNDFEPWWGWLLVEDIIPSSSPSTYDSTYRLFGTNVAELFDLDLTGNRLSEVEGYLSSDDIKIVCKVVSDHVISIQTGPMKWRNRAYKYYSFIEPPLADNGRDVDKILSLVALAPNPDDTK